MISMLKVNLKERGTTMTKIKTLGEAYSIYQVKQIIDLDTELGKELYSWFKNSSYTLDERFKDKGCVFVPSIK